METPEDVQARWQATHHYLVGEFMRTQLGLTPYDQEPERNNVTESSSDSTQTPLSSDVKS